MIVADRVQDITDEMVEKAARAIACTGLGAGFTADAYWDLHLTAGTRAYHRAKARVALTAGLAGRTVVETPKDADELAARVLDEHLLAGPRTGQCRCGWGDGSDVRTLGQSHSKHAAGQLRAAGALARIAAESVTQKGDDQ